MPEGAGGIPPLSVIQAQAHVETMTAPKIEPGSVESKIKEVRYLLYGTLTLCLIEMHNGWIEVGQSKPTAAANFDPEVGKRFAYEDAFRSVCKVEGYLLRERLHLEAVAEHREHCGYCEHPDHHG